MTDDINKSNEAFSLEPDAIFSHTEQYNPPALHLYQNREKKYINQCELQASMTDIFI